MKTSHLTNVLMNQKQKIFYNELNKIRGNHEFEKANTFRDDFTHNFSPCEIGPGYKRHIKTKKSYWLNIKLNWLSIKLKLNKTLNKLNLGQIPFVTQREDNHTVIGTSLGGDDYERSKDIINNAIKILDLLAETLSIVKNNKP